MSVLFSLEERKRGAYLWQESVTDPFVLCVHFRLNPEVALKPKACCT